MIKKIKKPVSILLALMMVVSLFAIVPITASADVGDFVPESEYMTFTAVDAGASVTLNVSAGSNLQYNKNNSGWQSYTVGAQIDLENAGDSVRFSGKNTTFNYAKHVSIGGKVACSGNVMSLRLDDDGRVQGLSDNCFNSMFKDCTGLTAAPELPETTLAKYCYYNMFSGCANLTTAPELPATMLARACYSYMFSGCTSLTTAPELPATALDYGCYQSMFDGCGRLTTAPELPATTLATFCYSSMFAGCESIKLSETETPEYSIPYSVPSGGDGTTAKYALNNMFVGTGGTFAGTPEINKTYYLYREVPKYTVTWKNGDDVIKTDTVEEGATPTYDGETPTKAADGDHMYVFSGWTPEITAVTGDATYTATFTSSADLVEITDHETAMGDLGFDYVMSEWGRSMTAQEAITLAQYMSAQNDGAKCAVLYEAVDDYDLQYAMSDGTTGSHTDFYGYALNDFLPDYKVYYLPVNLNPETIELNLNRDNATVIWYDATDSDGYWSMEAAYNNDGHYLVLKGNSNQPAGTYEWADMGSGCEIIDYEASQNIYFVNGSCTVTVNEDVVTVSGTFTGRDRNTYVVTVTHEAPYYTITDESVNGTVTAGVNGADVTKAKAGKTVLLNVTPADGYQLKSITASAQKTTPEDFSDLVALMGDAVFDGDEDYNCAGYTCKVEDGKLVVYNGTTLVTELSESNMTGFNSDYVEANSNDNVVWNFYVENGEITGIDVMDADADYDMIFSAVSGSKSTGTLQPVQVDLTTVAEGSQYSFTMPAKNVTVKAEFEAIPTYTVTWKNGDTVLKTDTVEEGTTPTYDGETPYKADGADCIYTFSGWTPEVSAVTGDATYTATFTESEKPETIKDCNNKYGNFRLYSNVPIVSFSNVNDLLTGAIIPITYGDSNTMIPVQDAKGYSYKFYDQTGTEIPAQITDSSSAPGSNYELSDDVTVYTNVINFTRPAGCTAIYIVATAPAVDLFPQHSVSLGGDIGVNFYIDPAAAGAGNDATISVLFSWNGQTRTVDAVYDDGKGLFRATCDVVAAEVACDITAEATVNNVKQTQTDTYSVQTYAEEVYNNPTAYDSEKPEQLKELAKALLNYGAMAQTVFVEYMQAPVKAPADIVKTVEKTDFNAISADDIAGEATDLEAIATELGFKYYTSSVLYLQNNTLRLYFTPNNYRDAMPHEDDFKGNQSNYYYYVEKEKIAAAELDDQQTFTIGGTTFTFSALDYAKAVVNSDMGDNQKDLAKALYLYNQKANAYFDAAPAPVQKILVLDGVDKDTTVEDGYTITGTLKGDYKISIADGATVTLKDVDITCLSNDKATANFAGITPLGDATIMLEGANTVKGGYGDYPGIFVPANTTLTIDGEGSLTASSGGDEDRFGCGIGGGYGEAAGNIVINGGTITANGGQWAAGIGSGTSANCGNITITGGTITANGGENSAGIGGGWESNCGDITITGGTVTATGGESAAGIGSGYDEATCGNITITGGTITATGGDYAAGIGSGYEATCGNITIADTVTSVTATKGSDAPNSIGAGADGSCGTVTIEDGANVIQN